MNNPELYHKSNGLQKRDALQCLEEYAGKIKWRNYDRVLDIGCGDGGVTTSILKKFMPDNFKRLVGCDISEKMVQFANDHYRDERTSFVVLDIQGDLPEEMKASFDHVFSFYTLHWVIDQERAFDNIYRLLSDGGDCLLIFLGHIHLYDIFRKMSKGDKWRPWLRDVDRFVSPYHDSQEPEKKVRRMMAKIGYNNITVECKEMSFVFDKMDLCRKAVAAVNPFKIPADLEDEFLDDYLEILGDIQLMNQVNNNADHHGDMKMSYSLLVAYGTK